MKNKWRDNMFDHWLKNLLKKAIDKNVIGGLFMMDLFSVAVEQMKINGLKIKDTHNPRTLLVEHFGKEYLVILVDGHYIHWYAGFFELIKHQSYSIQGSIKYTGKWIGYCRGVFD